VRCDQQGLAIVVERSKKIEKMRGQCGRVKRRDGGAKEFFRPGWLEANAKKSNRTDDSGDWPDRATA
jgi:hypothetical protein